MGKASHNNSKVGNGTKKFRKAAESSFSITSFFKPTVKSPEVINLPASPVKNDNPSDKDEDEKKDKKEEPVVVEIEQEEADEDGVKEGKQEENEENVVERKEVEEENQNKNDIVQEEKEEQKQQQNEGKRKRGRPPKVKDDNNAVISNGSIKEIEQEEEEEEEEEEENIKKRLRVRKLIASSPPPPSLPKKTKNNDNDKLSELDQDAVNFLKSGIPTVTSKMRRRFNFFKGRADSKSPEKVEKSTPKMKKKKKEKQNTKVKKKKRMVVESDPESDDDDDDKDDYQTTDTDSSVQEVDEDRRRRRKKTTKPSSKKAPQPIPVIELDEEAIAFLKSGIPTAITKVQKQIELKKEEDEYYKTIQFFPVISHVSQLDIPPTSDPTTNTTFTRPNPSAWEEILNLKLQDTNSINSYNDELMSSLCPEKLHITISEINSNETLMLSKKFYLCCDHIMKKTQIPPTDTSLLVINPTGNIDTNLGIPIDDDDVEDKRIPWIDKHSVLLRKSQLAVHSEAVEKIDNWLRAWKDDIRDDGGKSRKFLEKRKQKNSESDFVTSDDEDHEIKTKTLLLFGPTGTGKTATVLTLAKKLGFEVVEVNFSTQRSGKEVLKRVEEATLSHRLESTKSCLLLFEDICLIESKEDEGFLTAVAQLISSSCRPIVMTMTTLFGTPINVACDCDTLLLDPKIDKKEPLFIHFPPQSPSVIVRKVLAPIVQLELFPRSDEVMPKDLKAILYSIARHCKGDIRQSINQTQLLIQTYNPKTIYNFHNYFLPYLDLNFIRKVPSALIHKLNPKRKSFSTNNNNNNSSSSFTRNNSTRNSSTNTSFNVSTSTVLSTTTTTTSEEIKILDNSDKDENTEIQQVKKIVKSRKVLQEDIIMLNNLVETLEFAVELDRTNTFFEKRSHHELHCDEDLKTGQSDLIKSTISQCFSQLCCLKFEKTPETTKRDNEGDESTGEGTIVLNDEESRDSADSSLSSTSKDQFQIASLIFDNDQDLEHEKNVNELHTDLEDYCGTSGDLMTSGQFNYDNFAYVRTIIKSSKLNSVGVAAKRNRRISCYFNRVSHEIMDKICDTFDFSSELKIAKAAL